MSLLTTLATALALVTGGNDGPLIPAHDFYSGWRQPNGASCCNETDCAPTDAKWVVDHWEARYNGSWVVVPNERVLKQAAPDGNPHLCAVVGDQGNVIVLCFAAPQAKY